MTTSSERSGRGVVVTGGGTGIGRAVARTFAAHGDQVMVVGRTESTLAETADGHPSVSWLVDDVADPGAAQRIVDMALARLGRIDVLVNNASVAAPSPLDKLDRESVRAQLATNLEGPIFLTQQALGALEEGGGTVVNIGSAGSLGRRAWPYLSVYGSSKVSLDFLTRTWAVELASRGIRVVCVAPGVVATGMGVRMGSSSQEYEQFLDARAGATPLRRVGQPEEIGWWVHSLCEPQAAYMTGAVVAVDGGASIS